MPKLPVITTPEVAPEPGPAVGPGPARVSKLAKVAKIFDSASKLVAKEIETQNSVVVGEKLNTLRKNIIRWKLDPEVTYQRRQGSRAAGAAKDYLTQYDELENSLAGELADENLRTQFKTRAAGLRNEFQGDLLGWEYKQAKAAENQEFADARALYVTEAAARARSLPEGPIEEQVMYLYGDPNKNKAEDLAILAKARAAGASEATTKASVLQHRSNRHIEVLQTLVQSGQPTLAREYLDLVEAKGELDPANNEVQRIVGKLRADISVGQEDFFARSYLAKTDGDLSAAVGEWRAYSSANPKYLKMSPQVEARMRKMSSDIDADKFLGDEEALTRGKMWIDYVQARGGWVDPDSAEFRSHLGELKSNRARRELMGALKSPPESKDYARIRSGVAMGQPALNLEAWLNSLDNYQRSKIDIGRVAADSGITLNGGERSYLTGIVTRAKSSVNSGRAEYEKRIEMNVRQWAESFVTRRKLGGRRTKNNKPLVEALVAETMNDLYQSAKPGEFATPDDVRNAFARQLMTENASHDDIDDIWLLSDEAKDIAASPLGWSGTMFSNTERGVVAGMSMDVESEYISRAGEDFSRSPAVHFLLDSDGNPQKISPEQAFEFKKKGRKTYTITR